jgi:lipopolysaccharide O-acetyltransferase
MRKESLVSRLKALGVLGVGRLALDIVFTKLCLPQATVLRRPFYVRNVGTVKIGKGFTTGPGLILDVLSANAKLTIGTNVKVNHRLHLGVLESVEIGDDVLMASNIFISDHSHGTYRGAGQCSPETPPNHRPLVTAPVKIGDRAWLGENVCVLPGVTIGAGAIIGAGSVVTTHIPENAIAAGSPARVIKLWDAESQTWKKA